MTLNGDDSATHPRPNSSGDPSNFVMKPMNEEQVGRGRRPPSPPPVLMPTRFHTTMKATDHDSGLVHNAQARYGRLLDEVQVSTTDQDDPFAVAPTTPCATATQTGINCASLLFTDDAEDYSVFCLPKGIVGNSQCPEATSSRAEPPVPSASKRPPVSAGALTKKNEKSLPTTKGGAQALVETDGTSTLTLFNPSTPGQGESDEDTPCQKNPEVDTCTRLETPSPPSRITTEPASLLEHIDRNVDAIPSASAFNLGRPSIALLDVLEEGFAGINDQFSELAGRVGMPFQQVVSRYNKQFARLNTGNFWNGYQKYHAAHKAQELARLTDSDVVTTTPTSRMAKCYQLFREEYPDTWNEILATYEEAEALGEVMKTVAQRQQLFNKLAKNHTQSISFYFTIFEFSAMAKAHGFEGVFIMAGSVVNQDGGLGHVFSTPGAEDFFADRCRADNNEIVGHFKAHIYHKTSLANVAVAFNSQGDEQADGSAKEGDETEEGPDVIDPNEREDHACVCKALVRALINVGCKWASGKLFPWKGMPAKLTKSGVVCYNFPHNVLFPGEEWQSHSKGGSKGISDLTLSECSTLLAALNNTLNERLHFKACPNKKGNLLASLAPIIHGAPPAYDSPHLRARRMFVNLTIDHKGVPRRNNLAATHIKKKGKAPANVKGIEVISIPDSDDVTEVSKPTATHACEPAKQDASNQKRKTRKQPVVVITRSKALAALKEKSDNSSVSDRDLSSPSGSEYEPDVVDKDVEGEEVIATDQSSESEGEPELQSRKCKSMKDISSRAAKKRSITIPSLKAKGKAKAVDVPKERRYIDSTPASSDNKISVPKASASTKLLTPTLQKDALPLLDHEYPSGERVAPPLETLSLATNVHNGLLVPPISPCAVLPVIAEVPTLPTVVAAHATPPGITEDLAMPDAMQARTTGGADSKDVSTLSLPGRPKPRLVMKKNLPSEADSNQDDAFSLHKRTSGSATAAAEPEIISHPLLNLLAAEEGHASSIALNVPESRPSTPQPVQPVPHPGPLINHNSYAPQCPSARGFADCHPTAAAAMHGETQITQQDVAHGNFPECFMFPGGGWYGPRGSDPRIHGYPGPFMGPYTPWGPYPEIRAQRAPPAAFGDSQMHGTYSGSISYDIPSYYYHGQAPAPPHAGSSSNTAAYDYTNGHPAPKRGSHPHMGAEEPSGDN